MKCPKCGYLNSSESPFCGLCKEVLKTIPRGQDSNPRADKIDSQVESAESFESWHQKGAGLRSQLSKTSRFLVSAIGLIAAIACFYWVVTQTGPAVPVIAIQSKILGGRFFAMLTFVILMLPILLFATGLGFMFDLITQQGIFSKSDSPK